MSLRTAEPTSGGPGSPEPILPYGLNQLDRKCQKARQAARLKCVVRGCRQWLRPPTRTERAGDYCPEHGIRVHGSDTFGYADYRRNLIVDADYFDRHIRGHPFKYETHRFGSENSEDALTWNTLRSLQAGGCLRKLAALCIGRDCPPTEPRLFLWGLELLEPGVREWDLLVAARERFESDLPVNRPKTEPDIALFLPGHYLILIEAKFCSGNTYYQRDRKTKLLDLTLDQMLNIYQDKSLTILDYEEAHRRERIHHQLWRNMTFAEWMAAKDSPETKAYHVNLVRAGCEEAICAEFLTLVRPAYRDRFEQIAWEQIHALACRHPKALGRLCRYLEQKTASLKPAFRLGGANSSEVRF